MGSQEGTRFHECRRPVPAARRRHRHHQRGRGAVYYRRVSSTDAPPPPIPPVKAGLAHVVIPGTALWFAGFVVLLFFIPSLRENGAMNWLWTFLSGWVLGLIGLSIYAWQRWAARRGTRGSSSMALDEQL